MLHIQGFPESFFFKSNLFTGYINDMMHQLHSFWQAIQFVTYLLHKYAIN